MLLTKNKNKNSTFLRDLLVEKLKDVKMIDEMEKGPNNKIKIMPCKFLI